MSNAVDERIVEAKFDAADFEKGVNKTIKKLDELKKELNIKESGKNITEFAKETSEAAEQAGKSLEKLGDRFTTFKGMIKQRILGSFADEIAGIFTNIQHNVTGLIRSLSSDQVGAGLNKYTEILNSVRTMTAAGIAEDTAYEKIKRLAAYSDQTSYSLDQMTSGMSKLVAAGMDVDKAEKSMEGLANMCASAGVNIYEAQRAFLNFSQAYSSGTMRVNDWMSFESLNMATENIMKVFMQAGEEVGTLVKSFDKAGNEIYKTSNKINKKIKANKEVATKGFRDTLNFGWLDKATMEQATAVLSYFEDLGVDINKLSDEDLKNFATKAFQAAKEAKSFADVIGTVKDVIATGWATSFEHIFGKLSEAKEFFTWLSESNIASILYDISEFRNDVLRTWGEGFEGVDEEGHLINGVFQADKTGRKSLQESLKNIDDLIGAVRQGIADMSPEFENGVVNATLSFPEQLGRRLGYLTRDFLHGTEAVLDYFTVLKKEGKEEYRILKPEFQERLEKIVTSFNAIISIVGKVFGAATETFNKVVVRIQPVIDAVVDAFAKLMEPFVDLDTSSNVFDKFNEGVDNFLTIIQPLLTILPPVIDFLAEIGKFFVGMAIDTFTMNIQLLADALGFLIELFGGTSAQQAEEGIGVIEGMKNDILALGEACKEAFGVVGGFFSALFEDLRKFFGLSKEGEGDNKKGGLNEFFNNLFSLDDPNSFNNKISFWFHTQAENIKGLIEKLPDMILNAVTNLSNLGQKLWNGIDEFLFGKKVKFKWKGKEVEGRLKTGFSLLLDKAIKGVTNWFKSIPQKIKDLWKTIDEFIFGKEVTRINPETEEVQTRRIKSGFSKWLDDTVTEIKNFFSVTVPEKAKSIWAGVVKFFFGEDITEQKANGSTQTTHIKGEFEQWFEDTKTTITQWITDIPKNLKSLWHDILSMFFTEDTSESSDENAQSDTKVGEKQTGTVEEQFDAWLKDTKTKIEAWASDIPNQLVDLWDTIVGFFFGVPANGKTESDLEEGEELNAQTGRVMSGFSLWLNNTITTVEGWAASIPSQVRGLWNTVLDAIFGTGEKFDQNEYNKLFAQSPYGAEQYLKKTQENPIVKNVRETVGKIAEEIKKEIINLPTRVVEGWNFGVDLLGDLFKHVTGFLAGKNAERAEQEVADNASKDVKETMAKTAEAMREGAEDKTGFLAAIATFGENLGGLIGTTIPEFMTQAWGYISAEGGKLWKTIEGIFENSGFDWGTINTKAEEIGKNIGNSIKSIPGYIRGAVSSIKEVFRAKSPFEEFKENLDKQLSEGIINETQYRNALSTAEKEISKDVGKSGLWEGIKEIGKSIGSAFQDIGPDIIGGLNTGLEWVTGWFDQITTKWAEGHKEGKNLSEILTANLTNEETGEVNPIWQKIQELGQTLKTFIVETIPNFLKEAFEEVKLTVPKLISGIFDGNGEGGGLFDGLFDSLFGGKKKKDAEKQAEEYTKGAKKFLVDVDDNLEQVVGKSGFNILDVLLPKAKADEAVEEAKREVVTFSTEAGKALEGLSLSELYSKQMDIENKLNPTTGGYLTKEQREALQEDLKLVKQQISDMKSAGQDAKAAEKSTEQTSGFLGSFGNLLGTIGEFATTETGKTIAIIIGLGVLIHELKDMFSITDEFESVGWDVKWAGITAGIIGLIALIGWLTKLNAEGDTATVNATMDTLNQLVGLVEKIGVVVTTIASLWLGGEALDTLGDFFNWRAAKDTLKGIEKTGKTLSTGEKIAESVTNLLTGLFGKLAELGIIAIGGEAIGKGGGKLLSGLFDAIPSLMENVSVGVGSAIDIIGPAIENLASLNTTIDNAITVANKIPDLFTALKEALSGNDKGLDANEFNRDYAPKLAEVFSSIGTTIYGLSLGLANFDPEAANADKLNDLAALIGDPNGPMHNFVQNLVNLMAGINLPRMDEDNFFNAMSIISSVLNVFANGIEDLDFADLNLMDRFFDKIDRLATGKDGVDYGRLNQLGVVLRKVAGGSKEFIGAVEDIGKNLGSAEEIKNYNTIIDMIIRVAQGLAKASAELDSTNGSIELFNELGSGLPAFAQFVAQFFTELKTAFGNKVTPEQISMMAEATNAVAQIMQGIGSMMSSRFQAEDITGFFTQFFSALTSGFTGETTLYDVGLTAGTNLDTGLAEAFNNNTAVSAAQNMADQIRAIFAGLNDPSVTTILPKITPVLDMSKFSNLGSIGNMPITINIGALNADAQGANPDVGYSGEDYSAIISAIDGVKAAVDSLGGETTAKVDVSGVSVNLNASALADELVGYIDLKLGKAGIFGEREAMG